MITIQSKNMFYKFKNLKSAVVEILFLISIQNQNHKVQYQAYFKNNSFLSQKN